MSTLLHDPAFWVAIGFVIFVGLAFGKAKAAITGGLDDRAAKIRQQLDEAAQLRKDAEDQLAKAQARRKQAEGEAKAMIDAAAVEAARLKSQAESDVEAMIKRRQAQALDKITQAEAAALAEVRMVAVETAGQAIQRVLAQRVVGDVATGLIDNAIGDLPNRLN